MPTYEYECQKCGETFDISQKMTEKPLVTCPDAKCKGKLRRLIGKGSGIIFKGPGFYATDYRSESYKKKAKEESRTQGSPCATCTKDCKA